MGSREIDDRFIEIQRKNSSNEFSMLRIEDQNRKWIDMARKDYMAVFDGGKVENMDKFLQASGFV